MLALPFALAALPLLVTVRGAPLLTISLGRWALVKRGVIALFAALIYSGYSVAKRCPDPFWRLTSAGLTRTRAHALSVTASADRLRPSAMLQG